MAAKKKMQLNKFVCFALYSASRPTTRLYKSYLEQHELTYPQFLVLFVLLQEDGRSVREISDALFLDSGTVTPLLKRMESKGLVRRERSVEDERVVRVFLTEHGASHQALIGPVAGGMLCDLEMSPAQIGELADQLHGLRETIDASTDRRLEEQAGEGG